jgi:hypothetical protein
VLSASWPDSGPWAVGHGPYAIEALDLDRDEVNSSCGGSFQWPSLLSIVSLARSGNYSSDFPVIFQRKRLDTASPIATGDQHAHLQRL